MSTRISAGGLTNTVFDCLDCHGQAGRSSQPYILPPQPAVGGASAPLTSLTPATEGRPHATGARHSRAAAMPGHPYNRAAACFWLPSVITIGRLLLCRVASSEGWIGYPWPRSCCATTFRTLPVVHNAAVHILRLLCGSTALAGPHACNLALLRWHSGMLSGRLELPVTDIAAVRQLAGSRAQNWAALCSRRGGPGGWRGHGGRRCRHHVVDFDLQPSATCADAPPTAAGSQVCGLHVAHAAMLRPGVLLCAGWIAACLVASALPVLAFQRLCCGRGAEDGGEPSCIPPELLIFISHQPTA